MPKSNHRLHLETLEGRDVPAGDFVRVPYDGPPILEVPPMEALQTLDSPIASALTQAWRVPTGTATAEWFIQLPEGQTTDVLTSLGATTFQTVPFWPNSYNVAFTTPHDIATFPAKLATVTASPFYYPLLPMQAEKMFVPNDPFYGEQWHLNNTGQSGGIAGADAGLQAAWDVLNPSNQPVRGTGVVIGIVDDSLQTNHPDLSANYSAALSWDYDSNDSDPSPVFSNDNHGTAVAGVSAARGNNGVGVSGAAPNATLAGLRTIGNNFSDVVAGGALSHLPQSISIYNNSWGPPPEDPTYNNGGRYSSMGPQTMGAMANGVANGRGGKGSIYVNSAGNGLLDNDNINYNAFSATRYALSIGAIDHDGVQSWYSEPGAAMFVTAYSNSTESGITTTDRTSTNGYNPPTSGPADYVDTNYTKWFGGTSSAAPLVSGIVALMLDANPNLTWRDVKHILARTAEKNHAADAGWSLNGAGFNVNHKYGFGAIDAAAAVSMARTWTNVPAENSVGSNAFTVNQPIPDNNTTGITSSINVTSPDRTIEYVEVVLNVTHAYQHDLRIVLTSPSGTQSVLAEPFFQATNPGPNITNWVFTTTRHWGESTLGQWSLKISDEISLDSGTFVDWKINFHGTVPSAPTLANIEGTPINYTAGQGQVTLTNTLTVTDPEDYRLSGATVSITSGFNSSQDVLHFTNQSGITGNYNSSTGVLTLTGKATVAQYQTALRSVKYSNTSGTPSTTTRTVAFAATDIGAHVSGTSTRNITIAGNAAPVLANLESSTLNYTAGQGDLTLTSALTVTDADSANISGATISITSGFTSGQDVLKFNNQLGITGSYNSSTGVLTLSGSTTKANYETALRTVRYENTSGSPNTTTRTVSFTVTDSTSLNSNTPTRNIAVSGATNNPPVLGNLEGSTLNYTAGQGEVNITSAITVTDSDSTNMSSAAVIISNNFVSGQDVLVFNNQLGITGNYNSASGVLTLTGSTTKANYETALRSVRYNNTSGTPSTATRTVTFSVTDTTSQTSNQPTRNIAVSVPSGNPPVLANLESSTLNYTAGQGDLTLTSALTVTDADSANISGATISITSGFTSGQDVLKFNNQLGITGSYNSATGVLTLSGSTTKANYETALRTVRYENTSGSPNTTTRTVSFNVTDTSSLNSNTPTRNIAVSGGGGGGGGAGTISFALEDYPATEGSAASNLVVTVKRLGGSSGAISAAYNTSELSATPGSDYLTSSGNLSWADGETADKTFVVVIRPDSQSEGAEQINLNLSSFTGGATGGLTDATITIAANDLLIVSPAAKSTTFLDDDGDLVTVKFGGKAGTAAVALTNGKGPIQGITLTGTDPAKSSLAVSVKRAVTSNDNGRVTLGQLTGSGLAGFNGKVVNLEGAGIFLNAPLKKLTLGDVRGGADIVTQGAGLTKSTFVFGVIDDGTAIITENHINKFTAAAFGSGDPGNATGIEVPSLGTLTIAGNYQAILNVTGANVPFGKPALGSMTVAGSVVGSSITVMGNVGKVTVQNFHNSFFGAGFDNGDFVMAATIKSFIVTGAFNGFEGSNVFATVFDNIMLKSVNTDNGGTPFGFHAQQQIKKAKALFPAISYFGGSQGMDDFVFEVL